MVLNPFVYFKRLNAGQHPLGSQRTISALIAELDRSDSNHLLLAVNDWLAEIEGLERDFGADIAFWALLQLDQCALPARQDLLHKYLFSGQPEKLDELAWSVLDSHAGGLLEDYAIVLARLIPLAETKSARTKVAYGAVLAFKAWSLRKKLQRFRYRTPSTSLWRIAHDLMSRLIDHNLEKAEVTFYTGGPVCMPLREYLRGLYSACVPTENLVPQQMELMGRFLHHCDALQFNTELDEYATQRVDLSIASGPRRAQADDSGGPGVRFCSTAEAQRQLVDLANRLVTNREVPPWLSAFPISRELKETGLRIVGDRWLPVPPQRIAERRDEEFELKVVIGFDLAQHMVGVSKRVRAHIRRMEQVRHSEAESQSFAETGLGHMPVINDPGSPSPHEVALGSWPLEGAYDMLFRLEARESALEMETWQQVDSSDTGFRAVVPSLLRHHCVGTLIAFRFYDGLEWQLGIIRRIGRDASDRPSVGIETLGANPTCARAKLNINKSGRAEGMAGASGDSGVIVLSNEGDDILLPHAAFVSGQTIKVSSEEDSWLLQSHALRDRGTDYDRAQFIRMGNTAPQP